MIDEYGQKRSRPAATDSLNEDIITRNEVSQRDPGEELQQTC
jgi:hypothetical protein